VKVKVRERGSSCVEVEGKFGGNLRKWLSGRIHSDDPRWGEH
jgi:hypothetical protein